MASGKRKLEMLCIITPNITIKHNEYWATIYEKAHRLYVIDTSEVDYIERVNNHIYLYSSTDTHYMNIDFNLISDRESLSKKIFDEFEPAHMNKCRYKSCNTWLNDIAFEKIIICGNIIDNL